MVFDDLVFHHAHAGLLNRHLSQRNPRIVRGERGGGENRIHLILSIFRILNLRCLDFGDQRVELFPLLLLAGNSGGSRSLCLALFRAHNSVLLKSS